MEFTVLSILLLTTGKATALGLIGSYFASARFINGQEISLQSLSSLIMCLVHCGDECGAARYFPSSGICLLYSEVLLLTDDANVASYGDGVVEYRKVSPSQSRYLVVYSGSSKKSWDEALGFCQQLGSGLATLRNEQDFDAMVVAVNKSRVNEETIDFRQKAWLGGKKDVDVWKWYTGEIIENIWPFWANGQPDYSGESCMRIAFKDDDWMNIYYYTCRNLCAFFCE
ncbi:hypothetical protein MAR_016369 [Mya arenaria]|uniref:C-type lectin domain-containing protein n=1 Tax=Mya arenaria TaxID=6604 RepID=A0ABY7FK01_MYAAR|nr:hypothetical protein MAR_016369 [Mya arenaria]